MSQGGGLTVLVTGGAGFIGANLCRALLAEPRIDEVRILDDLSSGTEANLSGLDVRLVRGSILDVDLLDDVTRGATHVVHLAAVPSVPRSIKDPMRSHDANATGTLRVLEAARIHGGLHVTLASSSSVYGSNPAIPKSEDLQCRPLSPYAVSKLAAEQYAMSYAQCYRLPVLPFRFFNVFGPLQTAGHAYAAVVPAFLEAALADRPVPVFGDGEQSRDFTFVGSVVEVLCLAVLQCATSSPVNLAFGTRTTLNDLIHLLGQVLGRPVARESLPSRPGDVRHSQADTAQLRSLFPQVVPIPLRAALTETARWCASK
ncbi:MAG: NAD-dependent epimerase/dehydratase family protein [Actinomycetota bacterium]|nr:NAD-dependent epimerase/dehydratase family protein [Actinomycetota bacterium]